MKEVDRIAAATRPFCETSSERTPYVDPPHKHERSHRGENPKMAGIGALEAELSEEGIASPEEKAKQKSAITGFA